jgi:hypothetical protein
VSTKKTIEFHRGETWIINFTCRNADNTIMDLTGANVFFRVAQGQTEKLTKSVGVGITIPVPTTGQGQVIISKADQDTALLGEGKEYNYELKVDKGAITSIQCIGVLKSLFSLFYP